MRRRRLVAVKHRVVFGTKAAVAQVLAACGWQSNTAFVERLNLSLRQRVAAMRRRSATSCKGEDGLRQPLARFQVSHNFVLPHKGMAAVYTGDGSGINRPCMDIARGLALSGATVAPTADGLTHGAAVMIVV